MMEEPKERSWGDAFLDVADNTIDAIADGKSTFQVIGAGLQAGLQTEGYREQQEARARAARMAELQLQQAEADYAHRQAMNTLQQEGQRLSNLAARQRITSDRAAAARAEEQFGWQRENAEHERALRPLELRGAEADARRAEAQAGAAELGLEITQQQAWSNNFIRDTEIARQNFNTQFGYDSLNFHGQAIFDNSSNLEALIDADVIMAAYNRSPEEGDYALRQAGWKREVRQDENGVSSEWIISDDGSLEMPLDDEHIQQVMTQIQKQLKDDIGAAYISGGDATSIEMFSAKRIIENPVSLEAFGTKGTVLGLYNNFLYGGVPKEDGTMVPRFSNAQIVGHQLSEALQLALIDEQITEEEKRVLAPLFAANIKKMGGEVIWGNSVDETFIRRGDGSQVGLRQLARDLPRYDDVAKAWQAYQSEIIAKMQSDEQTGEGSDAKKMSDAEWRNYKNAYGEEFLTLSDEQYAAFEEIDQDFASRLKRFGKQDIAQLSNEELAELDDKWREAIEEAELPESFYSPFDNEIRRRKITSYQNEVARLEAELSEIQKQIDNGAPETEIGPRPSESYLILNFDENNNRVPTKLARRKLEIQEEITDYQNRISNHEAVLRDRGLIPVEGE
jgi:hypothetical protein